MRYISKRTGFSLIEIAIVIVIIALILGAVVKGRSIVKQARLQSTIEKLATLRSAAGSFRTSYLYWPGDLPDAVIRIGGTGTTTTCTNNACNGNGDDQIDCDLSNLTLARNECSRAGEHLSLAGMLEVQIAPILTSTTKISLTKNLTKLKIGAGVGAILATLEPIEGSPLAGIFVGGLSGTSLKNDALTYSELKAIDLKIDDGEIISGKVQGAGSSTRLSTLESGSKGRTSNDECDRLDRNQNIRSLTIPIIEQKNKVPVCWLIYHIE